MGFDSTCGVTPATILLELLFCPWAWGNFCVCVRSNILLSMVVQQWVVILDFFQEKMSTCPSTPPPCVLHIKTQRPHRDWARPVFESPIEVQVSSGLLKGQGLWMQKPGSHRLWHKPSWRRSPWTLPYRHWADDPQTAEQLYQRNSHAVKKVLEPTTDFPTWESGKGTENSQGIWLRRPVGFDYRTYTGGGNRLL